MTLQPVQMLHAHGVRLYVDPQTGRMRYRAPAGSLTPELRDLVAEVAMEYEERCAIREYGAGMERDKAERLAADDLLNSGCRQNGGQHEEQK